MSVRPFCPRRTQKQKNTKSLRLLNRGRKGLRLSMAKFYRNLADKRMYRELSQKAMAEAIGVAQSTYSLYEKGAREPNIDKIIKISEVLGVSADELLGIKTKQDKAYESFMRLDALDRAEILGTIKQMLKDEKYKEE